MRGDIKNMTDDGWDIDGHSVYVLQDALVVDALGGVTLVVGVHAWAYCGVGKQARPTSL